MGRLLFPQAFPEEFSLQRGGYVPFYRGPVLQRLGSIFKVLLEASCHHLKKLENLP